MAKRLYKLTILFNEDEDRCEYIYETVDLLNSEETNKDKIESLKDKDCRDILIKSQIIGDA